MKTSIFFSLQRFILVLKRHMVLNQKVMLIGLAVFAGILMIPSLIEAYFNDGQFNTTTFSTTGITYFYIWGFIFTSMVFNELHSASKGQFFLTLPASNFEKFSAAWLITAPAYALVAFLVLLITSFITSLISALLFGSAITVFNPFTSTHLLSAGIFLVVHSIFFLGAIYFRKNNFLKTLLAAFVLLMVIGLWGGLIGYLFFGTPGMQFGDDTTTGNITFFTEVVPTLSRIVFWGIIGPFFLVVSYFRFKEREV